MADAEHFSLNRAKAVAQAHVVFGQNDGPQIVRVMPIRHADGCDPGVVSGGIGALEIESPGADGAAGGLGVAFVAGVDVGQPLLQQHVQRCFQPVQQVDGRRVGEEPGLVGRHQRRPIPVAARRRRRRLGQRFFRNRDKGQTWRGHQPLLRAGDGHVDLPFVMPEVGAGERRNRVHHQHRRVLGLVHRRPNGRDAGHATGGGLGVHDAHRLDPVFPIFGENRADGGGVGTAAPVGVQRYHVQAQLRRHLFPQMGELAGAGDQHPVARL